MKPSLLSIIIPVFNEAKHLPELFSALEKQREKNFTIFFIDNASTDSSLDLLRKWKRKKHRHFSVILLQEKTRGFAPPLAKGIKAAKSPFVATLDADCIPHPNWAAAMIEALQHHSIIVGDTSSLLSKKPTASERLSKTIFQNYSERAANAEGHALPWGPTCNLGIRKEVFSRVGSFSAAAGSAFDLDWCWRAVLQGERILFTKAVKVQHKRKTEEEAFLRQIHRYGTGEAWVQKQYAFLQDKADQMELRDPEYPLKAAFQGAERFLSLLHTPNALAQKAAVAFACGILEGHLKPLKKQKKPRIPPFGIQLSENKNSVKILVPGKGLLELTGAGKDLWHAMQHGKDLAGLQSFLQQHHGLPAHEAHHEAEHFLDAIRSER